MGGTGSQPNCQTPPPNPDHGAILSSDGTLDAGAYLESPNGSYQLIMQGDGNLVLYEGAVTCATSCHGDALWNSGTGGDDGATVTMQADGNLVVYYNGTAVWNSNTAGFAGDFLKLQDDGNLVIYEDSHALWDYGSGYIGNLLQPGATLVAGDELVSPGRGYELIMQADGNLVLYDGAVTCSTSCSGDALWNSGTDGDDGASVTMQADGNLVVYYNGTAVWNANTWGFSGDYLKVQDDGNLVIYQDSHPIWDWGSGDIGDLLEPGTTLVAGDELVSPGRGYELIMQGDGNLVLYDGAVTCATSCSGDALWNSGTDGDDGASVTMQADGNLVVYYNGTAVWNSNTAGFAGAFLKVQDDSNLVIYDGSTAIWDWASGRISGAGSGVPTEAETAAVSWAIGQIGSTAWPGDCLPFVQAAYADGASIDLKNLTSGVTYNANTDPEDVWGHTAAGTTGTGTPPYGALVFFNARAGYDPEDYSHIAIMGAGGEMISTPDAVDEGAVHYETLAQHASSGAYDTYVGWWLPDG